MEYYIYNGELYHHGVKGMKWYQNIFSKDKGGSGARKKKGSTSEEAKTTGQAKPKSAKDMSDEELRKATDRYNLEANYVSAKSRANPGQGQKGDSFAKKIMADAIQPALINAGRTQMEKYLNKQISKVLGNDAKDEMASLKEEAEKYSLKSKISTSKKVIETNQDWFNERAAAKEKKPEEKKPEEKKPEEKKPEEKPEKTLTAEGERAAQEFMNRYGNLLYR